jgi:hypothetical protein
MNLFNRKPAPHQEIREFDPQRHDKVLILGQDANGTTHHDYVRDKATQQIIGRLVSGKPTKRGQ